MPIYENIFLDIFNNNIVNNKYSDKLFTSCDLIISNDKKFVSKDVKLLSSEEFYQKYIK